MSVGDPDCLIYDSYYELSHDQIKTIDNYNHDTASDEDAGPLRTITSYPGKDGRKSWQFGNNNHTLEI